MQFYVLLLMQQQVTSTLENSLPFHKWHFKKLNELSAVQCNADINIEISQQLRENRTFRTSV